MNNDRAAQEAIECPYCNGVGTPGGVPCKLCDGKKVIADRRRPSAQLLAAQAEVGERKRERDKAAEDACKFYIENKRLQQQVSAAHKALRSVVKIADEAAKEWDADNDPRVGKILIALAGRNKGYRADITAIHDVIRTAAPQATEDDSNAD